MRRFAPLLVLLTALPTLAQEDPPAASVAVVESNVPGQAPDAPELRAALARLEANVTTELRQLEGGRLGSYRRRDGTLEWERIFQEDALPADPTDPEHRPHLPLGVFLRELGRAVATEDRSRLEELFEGTARTDLYHRHGLITLGGRLTAVPFAPRLQRFLGPTFVRELLRAQSGLAIAHLLPQMARGRLSRRTMAVSLAGLGLDTRTVRDELIATPWVAKIGGYRLAKNLGLLHKFGKLGSVSGFVFVVAETIVTVYFADDVEAWLRSIRDRTVARQMVGGAGLHLVRVALSEPGPDAERLADALEVWDLTWASWRDHLLAPALAEEVQLGQALVPLARKAAQLEEARAALLERAPAHPHLLADLIDRYGSLEAWWTARVGDEEQELKAEVEERLDAHARRVGELVARAYAPDDDADHFPADVRALRRAADLQRLAHFSRPSPSRLRTYAQQRDLLGLLRQALVARHGPGSPLLTPLDDALALVERTEQLDRGLVAPRPGTLVEALDGR